MIASNIKEIVFPHRRVPTCKNVVAGSDTEKFVEKFGEFWKPIPGLVDFMYVRDEFYGIHLAMRFHDDEPIEVTLHYQEMPFEEWKDRFVEDSLDQPVRIAIRNDAEDYIQVVIDRLKDHHYW